jgi:hypothetical protein
MVKESVPNLYSKGSAFLIVVFIAVTSYVVFINKTEDYAYAKVIDSKLCNTKNSVFSSVKKVCTNYKIEFSYEGKDYIVWAKLVEPVTESLSIDKVYFSSIRPKTTASIRPIAERGIGLILLALSALVLSGYCFYKSLKAAQNDNSS